MYGRLMSAAIAVGNGYSLERVSDDDLLNATRGLVGRSNQLLAALIAHLAEVEARGVHRNRACASLYTYCIYELRFSEDEAFRRVSAARFVRRFPALLDALAAGELHLTGLLLLGPHLTDQNFIGVMARAKHRTKKEILSLIRQLDPLPDVPSRIEPLGPTPPSAIGPLGCGLEPLEYPVRDLSSGDRPRDWMTEQDPMTAAADVGVNDSGAEPAPVGAFAPLSDAAQRYGVQFMATEEYVQLVEEAKALLSHAAPNISLSEIHLRALRSLVSQLKRKKYAVSTTARPEPKTEDVSVPRQRGSNPNSKPNPRQRGRHVPAAVRRTVFLRDGGKCTYLDDSGRRCREMHRLEIHHLAPFALGGPPTPENLTLRCRAHNALAAEQDFGRDFIGACAEVCHERFSEQTSAEFHT